MEKSQAITENTQSCCAVPKPAKYVGGVISFAALVGFGAATYLGKLNRTVGLAGAGVSLAALITSIAIKGKEPAKTDDSKDGPQKVTLRFQDMNDVDTLDKLVAAIKAKKDLQVLDLTGLTIDNSFRDEGQLLVAIAEHPTLELAQFGTGEICMWRVDGWQDGLAALAEERDDDVPPLLNTFLDRVDFITLPELPNSKLLPMLAERENLKGVALYHENKDLKRLKKSACTAILGEQPLNEEEVAFLKLLPQIDGGTEKGNEKKWNFKRAAWTGEKLGILLDACPNLNSLILAQVTREDQWTEELAEKVQTLLDGGCSVSSLWAEDLALASKDEPASARFKVAAAIATNIQPWGNRWTPDVIIEMLGKLPNVERMHIQSDKLVSLTPEVLEALKTKNLKSVTVELKDGQAGNIQDLQELPVTKVTFNDCGRMQADDVVWVAETLKPRYIKFSGKLPDSVDEGAKTIDGKAFNHYEWKREDQVLWLTWEVV